MSNLSLPAMTYDNLKKRLDAVRKTGRTEDRLAYATTTEYASDGNIVVKHHGNPIAHIGRTWFTLSHAGWHTVTTASRLHEILKDNQPDPMGRDGERRFGVRIKQGRMHVVVTEWEGGKPKQSTAQSFDDYDTAHFSRVDADHSYMLHAH